MYKTMLQGNHAIARSVAFGVTAQQTRVRHVAKAALFANATLAALLAAGSPALADNHPVQHLGRTAAESGALQWPHNPAAPAGAPNVLLIMTDDVGYGASSTFGGPVPTPTFDALAQAGIRYNRFHTAALCSPTRAALLTGRNPHNVGMGNVTNIPTGYEGYTSVIPKSGGTVARILRDNGYNTAMFGKSHLTPEWEMSQAGPFDRWPTGLGFEYFYGFLSADTNQWMPSLVENTREIEPPHNDSSFIFEHAIADKAIGWIDQQHAAAPDKPFFVYYAPGAAHAPHQAPKAWLEKFRGQFDQGWDVQREQTFARQKALGVVPRDARLTPRPQGLPAWATLNADQKQLYARLMEAYAANLAYADHEIGRVIEHLRQNGELQNTLVIYIQGDNGGSAEGGLNGAIYEQSMVNRRSEELGYMLGQIDKIGGPTAYNLYPAAWGWAMNTPFPYYKQVASQFGGTRNGMVMSWPGHMQDSNRVRSQFAFVTDIMPTILEAAGVRQPTNIDGVTQKPIDGISLAYTFQQPVAPGQRHTQVFEMMENFGVYHNGWFAGVLPKRYPWAVYADIGGGDLDPDHRTWQLFNIDNDYSQSTDLGAADPAKLKEMQALFWDEAAKNHILPIHFGQGSEGRPSLTNGRTTFTYTPGISKIPEAAAPPTIGHSFAIKADLTVSGTPSGVVVTQGGRFGGYALYLKDGRPVFAYNAVPPDVFIVAGDAPLPSGPHELTADFAIDKPARGAGGMLTLRVDGKPIASGRIERTIPTWISFSEGLDVGRDTLTPVVDDYTVAASALPDGALKQVTITIK